MNSRISEMNTMCLMDPCSSCKNYRLHHWNSLSTWQDIQGTFSFYSVVENCPRRKMLDVFARKFYLISKHKKKIIIYQKCPQIITNLPHYHIKLPQISTETLIVVKPLYSISKNKEVLVKTSLQHTPQSALWSQNSPFLFCFVFWNIAAFIIYYLSCCNIDKHLDQSRQLNPLAMRS